MSTCRSCDAEVVFVPSAKTGKAMILDAKPAKGVVLVEEADWHDPGQFVVSEDEPGGDGVHAKVVDVYTDHHVTCPDATAWKGKTR